MLNILANQTQVLCDDGTPLTGSITIYNHNTTVKANLFTLEDEQYVPSDNPIYISNGWLTDSLFVKEGLYDVVPEQYEGEFDDMSIDDDASHWVAQRTWSVGLDMNTSAGESEHTATVYGMSSLRSIDPTITGIVTVVGYWTSYDCEPRTFVWDASSIDDEDYGIVFTSNVSETGRWILVSDNKSIPSNYYGVPYSQLYINQLFGYAETNGSQSKVNPTKIILTPGEYGDGASTYIATGKTVEFMPGAVLKDGNKLKCDSVIAEDTTIGDVIVEKQKEAPSIWFKSLSGFFGCGADTLNVNGWYDNLKFEGYTANAVDKDFIFHEPLPKYTSAGGHMNFTNCKFQGRGLQNTFSIDFTGCEISDTNFYPKMYDVLASSYTDCTLSPVWDDVTNKIKTSIALGLSSVDCRGITQQTNTEFSYLNSLKLIGFNQSDKRVALGANKLYLEDCSIHSGSNFNTYNTLSIKNSTVNARMNLVPSAAGQNFYLDLENSHLSGLIQIAPAQPSVTNCTANVTAINNYLNAGDGTSFFVATRTDRIGTNSAFVRSENITFENNVCEAYDKFEYIPSGRFTNVSGVCSTNVSERGLFLGFKEQNVKNELNVSVCDGGRYYYPIPSPGYIGHSNDWSATFKPQMSGNQFQYWDNGFIYLSAKSYPNDYAQMSSFEYVVKKEV